MPEQESPDEAVAEANEEDRENPGSVAYVQEYAQNSDRVVLTIGLSCYVISAITTFAFGFIIHVRVGFLRL